MENIYKHNQYIFQENDSDEDLTLYTTSSTLARVAIPSNQRHEDYFCLASVDTSTQAFSISAWKSTDIREKITTWALEKERDIFELKSVTKWQKKCLDYQSVYNAYLLGAISEDEFEHDSDEYTSDLRSLAQDEIISTVERLNKLLDFKLTIDDIASYLQTEPSAIAEAIYVLKNSQCERIAS